MATKVASLFAEIGADISALKKGLSDASKYLQDHAKEVQHVGDKMADVGKKATLFMTTPIVAGFGMMINSASDLSETMNKVDVVFGDAADEVKAFGQNAAQSLGMSQQKALEAAGTFGNLFTAMGMGKDVSADMSTSLLTLAADLASFNNIDPTVALEKLRAGLVGEVEPLRTLGVNLSAAAVEMKAVEMGLVAVGAELDPAAKAQAAYALIMEQTTNAQGDFARTSDGLANSTRIVKAQIQDAAAEMGENLLPIALELTTKFSDLVEKFSNMEPAGQKAVLAVAGVAAATGPLLIGLGNVLKVLPLVNAAFIGLAANPVVLVVAGLAAIGFAAYTLIGHNEDLIGSTDEVASHFDELERSVRETQQRFEEYRTVINGLKPGTFAMNEAHAATITTLHGEDWALAALNVTLGETATATETAEEAAARLRAEEEALRAEQELLRQGMADLSTVVGGQLGPEIENFTQTQSDLETEMGNVAARIEELSGKSWLPASEREELENLRTEYGELQGQYEENATAHEEATRRILFDLLTQRAAIDGLSGAEVTFLTTVAEEWGLIDSATADAMATADEALGLIVTDSDGVVTGLQEAKNMVMGLGDEMTGMGEQSETAITSLVTGPMAAMAAEAQNIAGLVNSIEGTYDVNFNVSVTGDPIPDGGGGGSWSTDTGDDDEREGFDAAANDFVVPPGFSNDNYSVGFSSGEEVHVSKPGDAASVGGDTYYITINAGGGADGIQLYNQFKQALENDLRASERGGVQTSDY